MKRGLLKMMMAAGAVMMAAVFAIPAGVTEVKADPVDAKTTLQTAFNKFDQSEKVFAEYRVTVNNEGTVEVITHEAIEIDRANKVKNIKTEDPETHNMINLYTDLDKKITYSEDADGSWQKFPSDAEDLEGIGTGLTENGVSVKIVDKTVYSYDGEEEITIKNPATGADATYKCYRFKAVVTIETTDDEDEEDDEEEEEDEDADADEAVDTVDVYYYVTKDTNEWVHAEIKEGIMVSADLSYPKKEDGTAEAVRKVEIPKVAIETAVLAEGYVTPNTAEEDVSYEVKYKGKKAYLAVTKASKNKKKLTVKKSMTILDDTLMVTEISDNAFANNKKVETIVINANITKIGKKAFYNDKKLKTINIKSKKLKTIGKNSFDTASKKLNVKLAGNKKYKKKILKLIEKSRAKKAKKKTKLTVK